MFIDIIFLFASSFASIFCVYIKQIILIYKVEQYASCYGFIYNSVMLEEHLYCVNGGKGPFLDAGEERYEDHCSGLLLFRSVSLRWLRDSPTVLQTSIIL